MNSHCFFRRTPASRYLKDAWGVNFAPATLAKYAVIGGGPIFRRAGRVPLYSQNDLDSWIRSKLTGPMTSTSDLPSPQRSMTDLPTG
jgi:hypothetical protein